MAEWLHPISGRKNHLFTRDPQFPSIYTSACGKTATSDTLDPPMPGDPQCARCLKSEVPTQGGEK